MYLKHLLIILISLIFSVSTSHAQVSCGDNVRISGFATLGVTYNPDDVLGYRNDFSQKGIYDEASLALDSLLGVQLDANLTENLDATIQFVLKDREETEFDKYLEWGFLRYQPTSELGFRVGRVGVDMFMLSNYRQVGFAYLWTHAPTEVYGTIAFNHADGVELTYALPLDDGRIVFNFFTGMSSSLYQTGEQEQPIDLKPVILSSVTWENELLRARLGFVLSEVDNMVSHVKQMQDLSEIAAMTGWDNATSYTEDFDSEGKYINFYSAGLSYDDGVWLAQTEMSFVDSEWAGFSDTFASYLSVGRRIGNFTPYLVYSFSMSTESRKVASGAPPQWQELQGYMQLFLDGNSTEQQTFSLGTRWDVRHDVAVKLQWDHTWIDAYGAALWTLEGSLTEDEQVDVLSFNINYIF